MQEIPFSDLCHMDFRVENLFAFQQHWLQNQTFCMKNPRKQSALLYFCGSEGEFSFAGNRVHIPRGGTALIPEASVYSLHFLEKQGSVSTVLLEFCLSVNGEAVRPAQAPLLLWEETPVYVRETMKNLVPLFSQPLRPYALIRSEVLGLLYRIGQAQRRQTLSLTEWQVIEPGIRMLDNDEENLPLAEIIARCSVSPAYFRRLFARYAGMSPMEYRNKRRLEAARALLVGSSLSVREIAERYGFTTPEYFCRVFRAEYGRAPSVYREEYLANVISP